MNDDKHLRTMRLMAWCRAKGEMNSMLDTYWGDGEESFKRMKELIDEFVSSVESEGVQE